MRVGGGLFYIVLSWGPRLTKVLSFSIILALRLEKNKNSKNLYFQLNVLPGSDTYWLLPTTHYRLVVTISYMVQPTSRVGVGGRDVCLKM